MTEAAFQQILSLPPFTRARDFLQIAAEWERQARTTLVPSPPRYPRIVAHVHALSSNSQYALLGLPDALAGLSTLTGPLAPQWSLDIAKELAVPALEGPVGERELDEQDGAWFHEALSICHDGREPAALKIEHELSKRFFRAVAVLLPRYPEIVFKEVYGVVFPVRDTLDPIFVDLDRRAKAIGGMQLLRWVLDHDGADKDFLRDMLLSYACKNIRKEDTRSHVISKARTGLVEVAELAASLGDLLRIAAINDVGPRWGLPPFVLEEVARGAMRHALVGHRRNPNSANLDFVDYLLQKARAPSFGWSAAKAWFQRPEGTMVAPPSPRVRSWVFEKPQPCWGYGESFRTALRRDLGRRPLISLAKGRALVAPRPGSSELVFEIQDRLGLTSTVVGDSFEDFIEEKLSRCCRVQRGAYRRKGESQQVGDIDGFVVSSDEALAAAFECKAVSEIRDLWAGGDHSALEHFKRGFLKSQEQLLRLQRTLVADGAVVVERGGDQRLLAAPKEFLRVSVALRSHGDSVHRPGFANALLSHFCEVSVRFAPASGQSLPAEVSALEVNLRDLRRRIREHIAALSQLGVAREEVFSSTIFIDLEIFVHLADSVTSADELLRKLREAAKHKGIGKVITS